MSHVAIVLGHPDPRPGRYCRALAEAYAEGALAGGHTVETIDVANLEFPVVRQRDAWEREALPGTLAAAGDSIRRADHLVIVFPLWLGSMPALLKAFLEQVLRPGFAFRPKGKGMPEKLLAGKSARVIVTMGMPGFFYRWFYRAHSLKALERNILAFCGFGPVRSTVIGLVESRGAAWRAKFLRRVRELGLRAA